MKWALMKLGVDELKMTWDFRIYCYVNFGKVLMHPIQNKGCLGFEIRLVFSAIPSWQTTGYEIPVSKGIKYIIMHYLQDKNIT